MRNPVASALVFAVVGLVVGYLIFGRVGGGFVPVMDLIQVPENLFQRLGEAARGIQDIRRNILLAGGVGLAVGVLYSALRRR